MTERQAAGRYELTDRTVERGDGISAAVAYDVQAGRHVVIDRVALPEVLSGTLLADEWEQRVGGRRRGRTQWARVGRQPGGPEDEEAGGEAPAEDPDDGSGPVARRALAAARRVAAAPARGTLLAVHEVFEEAGAVQVVSELVADAEPLARLLDREGPLTPYRAAEVAADVLAALRTLHGAGAVHRNVTAWSVAVCADGTALLGGAAAGAAQEAACAGGGVTAAVGGAADLGGDLPRWGVVEVRDREGRMGSVGAVAERWSPEQAGPDGGAGAWPPPVASAATDLWALGVLLHRAVVGRAPFPEEDGGAERLLRGVRAGIGTLPDALGPLRPLVEQLLRREPGERPSAAAVQGLLAGVVARAPQPFEAPADLPQEGSRLPVLRPRGTVEVHRTHGRHARRGAVVRTGRSRDTARRGSGRGSGLRTGLLLVLLMLALVGGGLAAAATLLPQR